MQTVTASDEELMLCLKSGGANAFDTLVQRHYKSILNFAFQYLGNPHTAEDATQEIFLRVYQAAPRYEVKAKFTTWLYRIARNYCLNLVTKAKIQTVSLTGLESKIKVSEVSAPGKEDEDKVKAPPKAMELLSTLDPLDKEIIILHLYQNLSFQEIGTILGISKGNARIRMHRALKYLRPQFAEMRNKG